MLKWRQADATRLSSNIHAVQQGTQCFLMIEFYSSRMLALHVSDLIGPSSGAFLQAVFANLVCAVI